MRSLLVRDGSNCDEDSVDTRVWTIELIVPPRDLDAVRAINRDAFPRTQGGDTIARELKKYPLSRVYVIRDSTVTVGFCVAWLIADELHINNFAIGRRWRRRGAARALLAQVLTEAQQAGAQRATLEMRASNGVARHLYEGAGFMVTAVRPAYYSRPVEDALILWRDLESPDTV